MKKVILYSLIASGLMMNLSCDTGDVVSGAIGVGVGVGLGRHYEREHGRHHRRDRRLMDEQSVEITNVSNAQVFAREHNIPIAAAQKLEAAVNGLDQNGLAALNTIGLNEQDVQSIATNRVPEAKSVRNMASALSISNSKAENLIQEMNQKFAVSASDVSSDYWQACMDKGAWKTPQNNYCSSTQWNGCSPETGATACY